jgi:hypothetical protein
LCAGNTYPKIPDDILHFWFEEIDHGLWWKEAIAIDMTQYPNVKQWRDKLMQEDFYKAMHNSYSDTMKKMMS